jgi:hypothetical protein
MKSFKKWIVLCSLMFLLLWGVLNVASAAIMNVEGLQYGKDVSAEVGFTYIPVNDTRGIVRVSIENTSLMESRIKSFMANFPDEIKKARLNGSRGWTSLFYSDPMFHSRSFSFKAFSPFHPIPQGKKAEFAIALKGKGLNDLSDDSFFQLFIDDGLAFNLKAKDSSGKFRFDIAVPISSGMQTPIPSAVFLLGPALGFMGALRWAKRKAISC